MQEFKNENSLLGMPQFHDFFSQHNKVTSFSNSNFSYFKSKNLLLEIHKFFHLLQEIIKLE